jgi:hypothetical protein
LDLQGKIHLQEQDDRAVLEGMSLEQVALLEQE